MMLPVAYSSYRLVTKHYHPPSNTHIPSLSLDKALLHCQNTIAMWLLFRAKSCILGIDICRKMVTTFFFFLPVSNPFSYGISPVSQCVATSKKKKKKNFPS